MPQAISRSLVINRSPKPELLGLPSRRGTKPLA